MTVFPTRSPDTAAGPVTPVPRRPWLDLRLALGVHDPTPFQDTATFWRVIAQAATIFMAALLLGVFLYVARALLLPVLCAVVVGMTLGPLIGHASRRGIPKWLTA